MSQPTADEPTTFDAFGLDARLVSAVESLEFDEPTPIQSAAIPPLLEGRDIVGGARTGSGKTAAFGLPLLQRVADGGAPVRALVLTPTRELALQVTDALRDLAKNLPVRIVTIYGGTQYGPQLNALRKGVPVVVGTPGRVLDLEGRGALDLSHVEILVLDEADEMLALGFIDDVNKVMAATPPGRQVALFSATLPDAIRKIADEHLTDPVRVQVDDKALAVDHIEQIWLKVPERDKIEAVVRVLKAEASSGATIIFCRTRAGCAEVSETLAKQGVPVDALHGDLSQAARERVLMRLRSKRLRVLVATDVAARGIDVDHVTHVVNFDLPKALESYVHRIGRTARAGREGTAISLVTPAEVRRMLLFQRTLKVPMDQVAIPTAAQVARAGRKALAAELTAYRDQEGDDAASFIAEMLSDWSLDQIAHAALRMAAEARQTDLEQPEEEIEQGSTPRATNEVELFFPVGKNDGVRPGNLVAALTGDAGLNGGQIGRITILDRKSFVGMSREDADRVLATTDRIKLKGRDVPVAQARKR